MDQIIFIDQIIVWPMYICTYLTKVFCTKIGKYILTKKFLNVKTTIGHYLYTNPCNQMDSIVLNGIKVPLISSNMTSSTKPLFVA
jgi:hypothetical protein